MGHPGEAETQIPFGNDKQKMASKRMTSKKKDKPNSSLGYFLAVAKRVLMASQLTVFHQAAR